MLLAKKHFIVITFLASFSVVSSRQKDFEGDHTVLGKKDLKVFLLLASQRGQFSLITPVN